MASLTDRLSSGNVPTAIAGGWAHRIPRRWWAVPSIAGVIAGAYVLGIHLTGDPLADVHAYYDAGARLNAGLPVYQLGMDPHVAQFYRYPPLFAILFRPLALLPFELAAAIWEGLLIAAFGATLWRLGIRRPETWFAVGVLSAAIAWTLAIGQAEAIVTLLLTLGSPLAVALAGHLKLFPLLVGLFWLGRRDWQSLGRFIGWTVGLGFLQLVLDPSNTLAFPGVANLRQVDSLGNLSPFAFSPLVWAALVILGVSVTLRLGRTRWGWGAAVTLSVLASPRLFVYMLMTLLACLRPNAAQLDHAAQAAMTKGL